ncbi:intermembrane phospholipid transport protein YdbH family protein [Thorsellia anophelis]|uniref:Dicarboxylate transport n=1 Tax=Thorsellia anophelis DSM 18579 TaxID=1123402 RepID=A0A1I0DW69_9GAMM|nr:YdbH domain-containing protein [Thorsellia anophelis]SET36887.1 Dicarboxylate transport [Thorsellia anophelis DSM 18579]
MTKRHWIVLSLFFISSTILIVKSLAIWLPIVINMSLPEQWVFSFSNEAKTTKDESSIQGFSFKNYQLKSDKFYFHIKRKDGSYCPLLSFKGVNLTFTRENLPTNVDEFIFDISCINLIEETEPSFFTWSSLNSYLPPFNIHAHNVRIVNDGLPIAVTATHQLNLNWIFKKNQHFIRLTNPNMQLEGHFAEISNSLLGITSKHHFLPRLGLYPVNQSKRISAKRYALTIDTFKANITNDSENQVNITSKGNIIFNDIIVSMPEFALFEAIINSDLLPEKNNIARISLKQNKLLATLQQPNEGVLLSLPLTFSDTKISIAQGKWAWPYLAQKLHGNLFLSIDQANESLKETSFNARINMQTEAKRGKSNLVLTIPPTELNQVLNYMPFQLTGGMNIDNLALNMSVPGYFHINNQEPEVKLKPSALVRAWGQLINDVYIEEARFPLAGISITPNGINGRLQAILKTREALWGQVELHMDGKAINLLPDTGKWFWLSWGNGNMPLLNAKWDMESKGKILNGTLYVENLSTGLNQIQYGRVKVDEPRITLNEPIILIPNHHSLDKKGYLKGKLALDANSIKFDNGGKIDNPIFDVSLSGNSVNEFQFKGNLQSERFKHITINGRWDGQRLRGQGWWPLQDVRSFRNLFSDKTDLDIKTGTFYAQASFSAAENQGFVMGGHLVFNDVDMRYENSHISGLDFIMPYHFADHRWQFGKNAPVTLRIPTLENVILYQNMQVDLQGYYPFDTAYPLTVSNINTDLLGGNLSIDAIKFPQTEPAYLKAKHINSEQFWKLINPTQFTMKGRFGGEFELLFNDPDWLIKNGYVYNEEDIDVNLDTNLINDIKKTNIAAGAAVDWLSALQIAEIKMQLTLTNLGELMLTSRVKAKNSALSEDKLINLNYSHKENVLALWRSLSFKDDLHDWIESVVTKFQDDLKLKD